MRDNNYAKFHLVDTNASFQHNNILVLSFQNTFDNRYIVLLLKLSYPIHYLHGIRVLSNF